MSTAQEPKTRIGNCEADNDGAVHRLFEPFYRKIGECAKGKNRNVTDENAKNPIYARLVLRTWGIGRQLFCFSTGFSIHQSNPKTYSRSTPSPKLFYDKNQYQLPFWITSYASACSERHADRPWASDEN